LLLLWLLACYSHTYLVIFTHLVAMSAHILSALLLLLLMWLL
jgi:hypothetical protein